MYIYIGTMGGGAPIKDPQSLVCYANSTFLDLQEEDSLSIVDEVVFFIQRFHAHYIP